MKGPVRGRIMEQCCTCKHVWTFWTRDIFSQSIVSCPACGGTDTETLDAEVGDEDES